MNKFDFLIFWLLMGIFDVNDNLTYCQLYSALIISGGYSDNIDNSDDYSVYNSVEVFVPSTGKHCQLPDMPGDWEDHTMEGLMVCGGWWEEKSCITLIDGTWQTTTTLLEER